MEFEKDQVKPLLHIDIHGKLGSNHWKSESLANNLDFATMSMKNYMVEEDQKTLVNPIIDAVEKNFNEIYQDIRVGINQIKTEVETDPYLKGFWGDNRHTMNSQASKLGIPSLQLELAPDIR